MARQRQASLYDARWLARQEVDWSDEDKQFGPIWAERRNRQRLEAGWQGAIVPRIGMFRTWIVAFLVFLAADLGIIAVALIKPELLA